jgi:hypothetical protein
MWLVLDWVEAHCVVPDGFRKGAPFNLYRFQGEYLAGFYTVRGDTRWDADNPVLAPAFRYRRGIMVGPQKVGKNPLIAAQVCVEGVGPALFAGWADSGDGWACEDHGCGCGWEYEYEPGEPMGMRWPTPLIQITAFSEESTENTYDALRPMIEEGPLSGIIRRTGEEFIRLPGGGRIDTVTSSARARLGQRVTFTPQDEVGIWTAQNKMLPVAQTQWRGLAGMGGRASMTTNAWDPAEQSVGQVEYESADTDILRLFEQPPKNLSYENKRDRRKIHRIVYPSDTWRENGGHVDLDGIDAEAASIVLKDVAQAARFYGNMLMPGAGRAVDPKEWANLARPYGPDGTWDDGQPPEGTWIGVGFDGSISEDSTVLRGCTQDGWSFLIGKWERPPGVRGEDWRVPRLNVDAVMRETFAKWKVGRMLCDPFRWWDEIEVWVRDYGDDQVLIFPTNQDRRMGPATDRWITAIAEGAHTHDDDDTTNRHVGNAHKRKARARDPDDDNRTLYVLTKPGDGGKIDAAIADLLAYEAAMTMTIEERTVPRIVAWPDGLTYG